MNDIYITLIIQPPSNPWRLYLHKEPDSGGGLAAADDLLHVREVNRDVADRSKLFLNQKINLDRSKHFLKERINLDCFKLFLELYINN